MPDPAPAAALLAGPAQQEAGEQGSAGPRFAFSRVLSQVTPVETLTPTATPTPTSTLTPTATATGTVTTPTATPPVGTPPTPPVSGTPGLSCANAVGQSCTAPGAVVFSWNKTGSGTFTATATGPGNALAGAAPTIFIPTTANANGEAFSCTATSATFTTTCTGTTAGDPLCGATITVAFPLVGGGFGNATGGPVTGPNCPGGTGTTLVVCKTITFGPEGIVGIGGIGGLGGLPGLTITFTTTTPGLTIPAITIPAGSTGPVCTSTIPVTVGTAVSITEAVPPGFTLLNVTGGTLSGNTATLTIAAGANTLTFVNAPTGVIIPGNPPPLLPPPPLQFVPPPPPPLLPPPPPVLPQGGPPLPPELSAGVPIIPEADSILLLVGGLTALGAVGIWRARRRPSG